MVPQNEKTIEKISTSRALLTLMFCYFLPNSRHGCLFVNISNRLLFLPPFYPPTSLFAGRVQQGDGDYGG